MDFDTWKDNLQNSTGSELVCILMEEVERMTAARFASINGPSTEGWARYWKQTEMEHAERAAWAKERLINLLINLWVR